MEDASWRFPARPGSRGGRFRILFANFKRGRLLKLFEDMRAFLMNIYSFAVRVGTDPARIFQPISLVFFTCDLRIAGLAVPSDCQNENLSHRGH